MITHSGLLNLNKPSGVTSRRLVDHVQRVARPQKVGHAGTLDPLASGVLVVCVGAATRLIEYVQQMPKAYSATFLLGRRSPTEDLEGEVTLLENPPIPSLDQIVAAARELTGRIQQRPPEFSAVKIEGRRAYALARQGKPVPLEPRTIEVYSIAVAAYEYPALELRIECGSGTYVRSLGRDLAARLGTGAVMSGLVRTAIGSFRLTEAISIEELASADWPKHLAPPIRAVERLPRVELNAQEVTRIRAGLDVQRPVLEADGPVFAGLGPDGNLVAILTPRGPGQLGPSRVLLQDGVG